jgi:DNA-binding NtrC family response regulator
MAGKGPSILVVAADRDERALLLATLRQAGFSVVAPAAGGRGAVAALRWERFAAAVIALPDRAAHDALDMAHGIQPGLPAVMIVDAAAAWVADENVATLIRRPLDPQRLLGSVVELVLRDEDAATPAPRNDAAAELGIAAARLACLRHRRAAATAAGAGRLVQDLTHQIGEMRAACRGLAAAADALALGGCAG